MKNTLLALFAFAAMAIAPFASQASDKEVQNPKCAKSCHKARHQQVALFVSGRGIGTSTAPKFQTVSKGQTGQGVSITYFTGAQ